MKHDIVLKMFILDLLILRSGVCRVGGGGGGGSAGKILATKLLHFVILFNLICNMTMFCKS